MRRTLTRTGVLCAVLLATSVRAAGSPRIVFETRSTYNQIVVAEDDSGVRSLHFEHDGATQSAVKPGAPLELQIPYTRAAMVALALVPAPRRIAVIGVGGGAMPMFLHRLFPEARIDAVDIDREVIKVARRFFGFQDGDGLVVHVSDGRRFLESSRATYDLVFLDAYGKENIPRALATLEFLTTVRTRLARDGLVVGNVWAGDSNPLYRAMRRTYETAFDGLCELDVAGSSNRIFLARKQGGPVVPADLADRAAAFGRDRALPFDLATYARPGCAENRADDAEVLRDPPPKARRSRPEAIEAR